MKKICAFTFTALLTTLSNADVLFSPRLSLYNECPSQVRLYARTTNNGVVPYKTIMNSTANTVLGTMANFRWSFIDLTGALRTATVAGHGHITPVWAQGCRIRDCDYTPPDPAGVRHASAEIVCDGLGNTQGPDIQLTGTYH